MRDRHHSPAGPGTRQARAERILDASAELLLRHGYKRVTIDDVAALSGVGKGTIYLHWKTKEALFWAVFQREAVRLLEALISDLAGDPALGLPSRLMKAAFLEVSQRPLVRALLLPDAEVLGNLAKDETVAAAQRELAGSVSYLDLVAEQGLLRPGLTTMDAGVILGSVLRGFFTAGEDGGSSVTERADLLADVLRRSLEADEPPPPEAAAALSARVTELFTGIVTDFEDQLRRAY